MGTTKSNLKLGDSGHCEEHHSPRATFWDFLIFSLNQIVAIFTEFFIY